MFLHDTIHDYTSTRLNQKVIIKKALFEHDMQRKDSVLSYILKKRRLFGGFIKVSLLAVLVLFIISTVSIVSAQGEDDTCKACHSKIFESWNKTKHSIGYILCTQCHMERETVSPVLGVQCKGCHVPGQSGAISCVRCHLYSKEHAASGGNITAKINWSAMLCGECHRNPEHPQFMDWKRSKHYRALIPEIFNESGCQECHVAQVIVSKFRKSNKTELLETPEPINCQTCHDPHGSPNIMQLRLPPKELCVYCHTASAGTIGGILRHSQSEMFNKSIKENFNVSCYNCHTFMKKRPKGPHPALTGHSFEPSTESCTDYCH